MKINFNALNKTRKPNLILCNPNGEELDFLALAKDIEREMEYNEVSTLSFTIPKFRDESIIPYYDRVIANRIVKIEDIGTYLITKVNRDMEGDIEYKKVECVGLEYELADKTVGVLEGTYCLYDGTGGAKDKEIMSYLFKNYLPNWSIGQVDSALWNTFRTFEIKDNNVFNLLMGEMTKAFDCVFTFNTFNRTIDITKTQNIQKKTDIYLSRHNLLKSLNIEEDSDNLITALNVFGAGDLTIRTVNPMGNTTLYNFDYFIDLGFLTEGLVTSIRKWEDKYKTAETRFTTLLENLKTYQDELVGLQTGLAKLVMEQKQYEQGQALAIVAEDDAGCTRYKNLIEEVQVKIKNQEKAITNKQNEIDTTQSELTNIVTSLSIDNLENFTQEQRKELDLYIKQGSVTNDSFVIVEGEDSLSDQIEIASELMEWGKEQLAKCSQPIWTFDIDSINFTNLIEYKPFTEQLDLGSEVIIEVDKDKDLYAYTMLVGYGIDYEKPESIKLKFTNQLNFQSKSLTYEELFESSASISKNYEFDTTNRNKNQNTTTQMDKYIEQGFVDITKEVLATTNQEFEISDTGIRGREWLPESNSYSKEEVRMTKNVLAFSDDNFTTTKTAIGKITMPDGTKAYGVIAENLVGKQILGKTLLLETDNKSLVWDGNSLTIRNANIILGDDRFLNDTLSSIEGIASQANTTANTANTTANTANTTANSASSKVNAITTSDGSVLANKLTGEITGGKSNIVLGSGSNYMRMNEKGILITKDGGKTYNTAIGVDGLYAEQIKAGGTISGCNAEFGERKSNAIELSTKGSLCMYNQNQLAIEIYKSQNMSYISWYGNTGNEWFRIQTAPNSYYDLNCMQFTSFTSMPWVFRNDNIIEFHCWDMTIHGDHIITGTKSAVIPTQHYGARKLYCDESDRSYFSTKGMAETVNREVIVNIDPIFVETIELNSNYPYLIQLTSYSDAQVWVEKVDDYSFMVKSDTDTKFTYTLSAIRISCGSIYLEEAHLSNTDKKTIQQQVVNRMRE